MDMFEQLARDELRRALEDSDGLTSKVRRSLAVAREAEHRAGQLSEIAFRFYARGDRSSTKKYRKDAARLAHLAKAARDQARNIMSARRPQFGFGYQARRAAYPEWNMTSLSKPWRPKEPKWQ